MNEVITEDTGVSLPVLEGKTWRRACATTDVEADEGFRLGTLPPVAVFTSEGEYFCLDDTCSHETYSLSDGWVESGTVECALHSAKFELHTGKPLCPPATSPVSVHPVQVAGNEVYVALPANYLVKE